MRLRPHSSTRPDTLFPLTTRFRSYLGTPPPPAETVDVEFTQGLHVARCHHEHIHGLIHCLYSHARCRCSSAITLPPRQLSSPFSICRKWPMRPNHAR